MDIEKKAWDAMTNEERLEFLYDKQVGIREVVNKQSKAIKALKNAVDFCKAAISGLKFKVDNPKKHTDNLFDNIFGEK